MNQSTDKGPAPAIKRKIKPISMEKSVRASASIGQKPLFKKIGTLVVAMATLMSMIKRKDAGRVKRPRSNSRPQTVSTVPTNGAVRTGTGMPMRANRPDPHCSANKNFLTPSRKNTAPTGRRMMKLAGEPPAARSFLNAMLQLPSNHHRFLILAEDAPQAVRDFTHRYVGFDGVEDDGHQVAVGARRRLDLLQCRLGAGIVAPGAQFPQALHLQAFDFGIDAKNGNRGRLVNAVTIYPHHHLLPRLDLLLVFVSRLLNLSLHVPHLNGALDATHGVDLRQVIFSSLLDFTGQLLDVVGPAQRVHRIGDPALESDDLLRAQGQGGGGVSREGKGLVAAVGVERLCAAQHRGQRLQGDARDVHVRLLSSQGAATRLGVEAEHPGARVLGLEALPHQAR